MSRGAAPSRRGGPGTVKYPPELRREAALFCIIGGHSAEDVARHIGCTARSVHLWVKKTFQEMEEKGEA